MKFMQTAIIRAEKVTKHQKDFDAVQKLYENAFPPKERIPLKHLLYHMGRGGEFLAFYDGSLFLGFACLLSQGDITNIMYLAVDESQRGKGYGAGILEAVQNRRPQNRIVLDIEAVEREADNYRQRESRRSFYIRNGYVPAGIAYRWRQVPYEILIHGGDITEEEFWNFWRTFRRGRP